MPYALTHLGDRINAKRVAVELAHAVFADQFREREHSCSAASAWAARAVGLQRLEHRNEPNVANEHFLAFPGQVAAVEHVQRMQWNPAGESFSCQHKHQQCLVLELTEEDGVGSLVKRNRRVAKLRFSAPSEARSADCVLQPVQYEGLLPPTGQLSLCDGFLQFCRMRSSCGAIAGIRLSWTRPLH